MRQLAFVIIASLGLAACSASQLISERDDQACRAKGLEAGSVGYTDCRATLDKQRTENETQQQPGGYRNTPGTPGAALDGGGG